MPCVICERYSIFDTRFSMLSGCRITSDHRASSIEHPVSSIQYRVSSIEHRLYPITTNICQFIFDVIINPFSIRRQRIFRTAGPAVQINGLSGPLYLKLRLTLQTLQLMAVHYTQSSIESCGSYCNDHVLSNHQSGSVD